MSTAVASDPLASDRGLACAPLLAVLGAPASAAALSGAAWTRLLALARASNLLGTLAERVLGAGVPVPPEPKRHLEGMRQLAQRQRLSVHWEARQIATALADVPGPALLLKGAAYVLGRCPSGEGRLFGDVDILVPRDRLDEVESALLLKGWVSAKRDPYDQRYYREWMHELPPMVHVHRHSALDVHHNLLPPSPRHHPDMDALRARARPLPDYPGLAIPAPEDLLIHSLTHLVHEGEPGNGLRDLVDIDAMLRAYPAQDPAFWTRFAAAVDGHGLHKPVAMGLRLAELELGTPLPATLLADERAAQDGWMLTAFRRTLHAVARRAVPTAAAPWSSFAVFLRGHALRMPAGLLVRHLLTKAWRDATQKPPRMPDEDDAAG